VGDDRAALSEDQTASWIPRTHEQGKLICNAGGTVELAIEKILQFRVLETDFGEREQVSLERTIRPHGKRFGSKLHSLESIRAHLRPGAPLKIDLTTPE
jgi:hypothetical protein